jgi:SAM-dependent methyltransferase
MDWMQRWALPAAQACFACLQLDGAHDLLETGVGAGASAPLLRAQLPPTARYCATDVSKQLVDACKQNHSQQGIEYSVANASALPFEKDSFDRYFSSLTLQIVKTPKKMVSEARRVLRPGGIAAFTIWGTAEKSHMYSLESQVMEDLGVEDDEEHPDSGKFDLGDASKGGGIPKLRAMFQAAGFKTVVAWHQMLALDVFDGQSFVHHRLDQGCNAQDNQDALEMLLDIYNLEIDEFRQALADAADKVIERGEPLGLDAIIVIAK